LTARKCRDWGGSCRLFGERRMSGATRQRHPRLANTVGCNLDGCGCSSRHPPRPLRRSPLPGIRRWGMRHESRSRRSCCVLLVLIVSVVLGTAAPTLAAPLQAAGAEPYRPQSSHFELAANAAARATAVSGTAPVLTPPSSWRFRRTGPMLWLWPPVWSVTTHRIREQQLGVRPTHLEHKEPVILVGVASAGKDNRSSIRRPGAAPD
jgi:hypothetical protein